MKSFLERYILDVIHGRRTGFNAQLLKAFLRLLSWPFQFVVKCRNKAFDKGWVRRYFPPVPVVISVGNIVAGGTGKTPMTFLLAEEFYSEFPLAILSRGYRSHAEKLSSPVVLSRGAGPMHPASFCGDEPFLLAKKLPKAFVFVGKDRHKASYMAAKAGVQVILLDDGMQHRRLARDFEVVVMDVYDPFGKGYFLPRGFLREGLKSLSRADLIILNHAENQENFLSIKQQIQKYSSAPVVGTKMTVSQILDFSDRPVGALNGKKVGIFCGIAHPEYFQNTVQALGAEIVSSIFAADHCNVEPMALVRFARQAQEKGAEVLVCTEKDRVKITDALNLCLPLVWIQMSMELISGKEEWKTFIDKAKTDLRCRL